MATEVYAYVVSYGEKYLVKFDNERDYEKYAAERKHDFIPRRIDKASIPTHYLRTLRFSGHRGLDFLSNVTYEHARVL